MLPGRAGAGTAADTTELVFPDATTNAFPAAMQKCAHAVRVDPAFSSGFGEQIHEHRRRANAYTAARIVHDVVLQAFRVLRGNESVHDFAQVSHEGWAIRMIVRKVAQDADQPGQRPTLSTGPDRRTTSARHAPVNPEFFRGIEVQPVQGVRRVDGQFDEFPLARCNSDGQARGGEVEVASVAGASAHVHERCQPGGSVEVVDLRQRLCHHLIERRPEAVVPAVGRFVLGEILHGLKQEIGNWFAERALHAPLETDFDLIQEVAFAQRGIQFAECPRPQPFAQAGMLEREIGAGDHHVERATDGVLVKRIELLRPANRENDTARVGELL